MIAKNPEPKIGQRWIFNLSNFIEGYPHYILEILQIHSSFIKFKVIVSSANAIRNLNEIVDYPAINDFYYKMGIFRPLLNQDEINES